jgi:hypothetical protein
VKAKDAFTFDQKLDKRAKIRINVKAKDAFTFDQKPDKRAK